METTANGTIEVTEKTNSYYTKQMILKIVVYPPRLQKHKDMSTGLSVQSEALRQSQVSNIFIQKLTLTKILTTSIKLITKYIMSSPWLV